MKWLSLLAVMLASVLQTAVSVAGPVLNVDPDAYAEGTDIRNGYAGITLSILKETSTAVFARSGYSGFVKRNNATTGSLVFGQPLGPGTAEYDNEKLFDEVNFGLLRADFASFVNFVSIDLLFDDDDIGLLRAFDSSNNPLQTVIASGDGRDSSSPFATVSISRASNDIAYIVAGGQGAEALFLDNLRYSRIETVPEPTILALMALGLAGVGYSQRRRVTRIAP